jgi:hypothetical protein
MSFAEPPPHCVERCLRRARGKARSHTTRQGHAGSKAGKGRAGSRRSQRAGGGRLVRFRLIFARARIIALVGAV